MTLPYAPRLADSPSSPFDPAVFAEEMFSAYVCACDAWTGYLADLAAARGPLDVMDAGAKLTFETMDLCRRVAGVRLQDGGLAAPLLNDA